MQQIPPITNTNHHSTTYQKKKHKNLLNQLLQDTQILVIKSNDPKIILSARSKSMRTMSRPYTMAGQRGKLKIKQQQNKRQQTDFDDIRRKLDLSIKQKGNKPIIMSKQLKNQKHKLKQCIGKLNLLKQTNELCTSDPIELIFQFFQCLSKTQNYYQGIFKYITETLRQQTIFNKKCFNTDPIKFIIDKTKNQNLIRALYSQQKIIVSYKQVCKQLCEQVMMISKNFDEQKHNYEQYTKQLQNIIQQKRKTIIKMKQTVKYYSEHPSQNLYPVVQKLQQQVDNLNAQLQVAKQMNQQTLNNYQLLKKTNMVLGERIDDLKNKINKLQYQKLLVPQPQQNKQLIDFQKHVDNLKHMLDKSIVRMVGMKDQFNKLQTHNQSLINQRSELARRAAVGFSQLTPRPNLKQIFQNQGLNFQRIFKLQDRKQKKINTQQFVRFVVTRFKQTFKTFKQLQATKKIVYDNKGNPLNKIKQKKPENILDQVIKGKQKLRQIQKSGEALRNQYNKLVQQKLKKPAPLIL